MASNPFADLPKLDRSVAEMTAQGMGCLAIAAATGLNQRAVRRLQDRLVADGVPIKPRRWRKSFSFRRQSDGSIAIPLAGGGEAIIDERDLATVARYQWSRHRANSGLYYAHADTGDIVGLAMHRLLLGADDPRNVDHRDGDGLNNRRKNIRWASQSQNMQNRRAAEGWASRFKGVIRSPRGWKWVAKIKVRGSQVHLGTFATEVEAARAYDAAAKRFFGSFARANADLNLYGPDDGHA